MVTIPASEFKRRLSEFLSRVIYRNERIVITRRGKPVAQITPADAGSEHLCHARGWLSDSDPFFNTLSRVTSDRARHAPRVWNRD